MSTHHSKQLLSRSIGNLISSVLLLIYAVQYGGLFSVIVLSISVGFIVVTVLQDIDYYLACKKQVYNQELSEVAKHITRANSGVGNIRKVEQ